MYDGRTRSRATIGFGGSHQPQPGKGSALPQQERRADPQRFSWEDSAWCLLSSESAHEAVGAGLPDDHKAGVGRADPDRQRDGSSVSLCRNTDPRFAPKGQDSRDPALPESSSHPRGPERSQTPQQNREPALQSGPAAPRGARGPAAEAGRRAPQGMFPSWSRWFGSKDAAGCSSSRTSSLGRSPDQQLEPSKEEAKTTWRDFQANEDAMTSDTDKMKTNLLEAKLQALKNSPHPQSLEFLQALEKPMQIVVSLLAENQQLRELSSSRTLQGPSLQAEDSQQQLLKQQVIIRQLAAEIQRLKQELQELKNTQVALQAENQDLREMLKTLGTGLVPEREATSGEMPVPRSIAFPVQVRVTGQTGGCEKQFLGDVAKLLVGHGVSLQVEEYREDSPHLLLLFSVISSRAGTNIDNALCELKGVQKTLLVVLHHKSKDSTRFFADRKPQVQHPALVAAIHAYFSVHDGFYYCPVNEDAVTSVAETIMQLTHEN